MMEITDRFAITWQDWDAHVRGPGEAAAFLESAKDEQLTVSAAASVSLDTTKVALDAAREHVAALEEALKRI